MPLFANIEQLDIEQLDIEQPSILSNEQIEKIQGLHLPSTLLFKTAQPFDTKRIITKPNIWEYNFSGSDHRVVFTGNPDEIKIKKYIIASFISKNSPSGIVYFNSVLNNLFSYLNKKDDFSYETTVSFLEDSKNNREFYLCLYVIKVLCANEFPKFSYDNIEDLEFIPRPDNDAWLSYQDIDNILSMHDKNMITKGIKEISIRIENHGSHKLTAEELIDSSILGLCYACGIRPVQLSRLAIGDLRVDSNRSTDDFKRYSLAIPYAKQQHLVMEKILVAIPSELAIILLEYQKQLDKKQDEQFFDVGSSASKFVNEAINRQMVRFAPEDVREAINNNTMIQPHYSSYDFRHNIGHSLAMSGASADEIAHILGHSSLVTAKHYIMATPELAAVRARALGTNPVWQTMISMMLTGAVTSKKSWKGREVFGVIDGNFHSEIGGCSRPYDKCPFSEVRACYSCLYYHPFVEGEHDSVLLSVKHELIDLIEISDSVGYSANPLIQIQESTKLEVESVIARCNIYNSDTNPIIAQRS